VRRAATAVNLRQPDTAPRTGHHGLESQPAVQPTDRSCRRPGTPTSAGTA